MKWKIKCWIFLIVVFCCVEGIAWWDLGHFVTAQIASTKISNTSLKQIDELLKTNIAFPPKPDVAFDDEHLVECATWMDNINSSNWPDKEDLNKFKTLHYTTFPYDVNEKSGNFINALKYVNKNFADREKLDGYDYSAVTAVLVCIKTLITKSSDKVEKAVALRMLVHLLGDIHCPMHSVEPIVFESQTFGGNLLRFKEGDGYDFEVMNGEINYTGNMHKVWDGLGGVYKNLAWPVTDFNKEHVTSVSKKIMNDEHLFDLNQDVDIREWAAYTMMIGRQSVNSANIDYVPNQDGYLDHVKVKSKNSFIVNVGELAKQQLFKGGVRLAGILMAIFDPDFAASDYLEFVRQIKLDQKIPCLQKYLDMIFLEHDEDNLKKAA